MKASSLHKLLVHSFGKARRVLVKGKPGIGKSDVVAQAAKVAGATLILRHASIDDPVDYKGMPCLHADGHASFVPFDDLSRLIAANTLTVCFLDDIGQAPPAVQAALMQLVLARRVNGFALSNEVVFCGATNDTTHMAGVSGMIEPLKSRWDTIVEMEVDHGDWCEWGVRNNMPAALLAYIRNCPQALSEFVPTKELRNTPSPRGWAAVGRWVNEGVVEQEVIAGAVGVARALEFSRFMVMMGSLPDLQEILRHPTTAPVPNDPGAKYAVVGGLARLANLQNLANIMTYTRRLPKEFDVTCVSDIVRLHDELKTTVAFKKWAMENKEVLL